MTPYRLPYRLVPGLALAALWGALMTLRHVAAGPGRTR
jgi:hypothetical protein